MGIGGGAKAKDRNCGRGENRDSQLCPRGADARAKTGTDRSVHAASQFRRLSQDQVAPWDREVSPGFRAMYGVSDSTPDLFAGFRSEEAGYAGIAEGC